MHFVDKNCGLMAILVTFGPKASKGEASDMSAFV